MTPTQVGLSGELWTDGLGSWSWPGFEGRPVTVDVMSDADEVGLVLNGHAIGRQPAGKAQRYQCSFETTFAPGEIVAVAYRDGTEVARTTLCSGSAMTGSRCGSTERRSAPTTLTQQVTVEVR